MTPERPDGYPETPMLDRMQRNYTESQSIGTFLDWLRNEREPAVELTVYPEDAPSWYAVRCPKTTEQLLAEHFFIDLAAVERERGVVLAWERAQNKPKSEGDGQ